jgi:hypothetical protein
MRNFVSFTIVSKMKLASSKTLSKLLQKVYQYPVGTRKEPVKLQVENLNCSCEFQ